MIQSLNLQNTHFSPIRFNMPQKPLTELRPQKFPRIGDEEDAFNSYDEDTDDEGDEEEEDRAEGDNEMIDVVNATDQDAFLHA